MWSRTTASLWSIILVFGLAFPQASRAWDQSGHFAIAYIAYHHLTLEAREKADKILKTEPTASGEVEFVDGSTWADAYRLEHPRSAAWHYIDMEIDSPSQKSACFGFPEMNAGAKAIDGPQKDCLINKINQFSAELVSPDTSSSEKSDALKFLISLVADVHEPLHTADHNDRGGNCVQIITLNGKMHQSLHAYWDRTIIEDLIRKTVSSESSDIRSNAIAFASKLDTAITDAQISEWTSTISDWDHFSSKPWAGEWANESFVIAQNVVYDIPQKPTCADRPTPFKLSAKYQSQAERVVREQIEKGGVRLAALLNIALTVHRPMAE